MQKTYELPQTLEAINEEMEQLRSEMAQQHTQMQARAKALFAPEKGEDTRSKIAEAIRKRGIKLNSKEMENLVDDIADELSASR